MIERFVSLGLSGYGIYPVFGRYICFAGSEIRTMFSGAKRYVFLLVYIHYLQLLDFLMVLLEDHCSWNPS